MLIQSIQSYNSYQVKNRNTKPNFKGELGEKVVKDIEALGYDSYEYDSVSKIMKNNGVGSMGLVSTSKVKDILHEVAINNLRVQLRAKELDEKENSFDKRMNEIRKDLYNKELELNSREKNAEKLFEERNKKLDERESLIDKKETAFKKQEELKNQEFIQKEAELKELEQKITNETKKEVTETVRNEVTETIRKEEKEKAYNDLADKYSEIANTEVALDKRAQALDKREQSIINAESIMKQAEIDKIKGDLRVLYDIDDDNLQSYDSFGEQMIMVSDVFNRHHFALKSDPNPEILDTVTDILRNNEGGMDKNTVIFLERILRTSDQKVSYPDLCSLALIAKDDAGNLDLEKSCYIIASLSCRNSDPREAIDACLKHYNLDNTEDKTPDNYVLAWGYKEICADNEWTNLGELTDFSSIDLKKCSKGKLIQANKMFKITKLWANRNKHQDVYNDLQKTGKNIQKIIDEK